MAVCDAKWSAAAQELGVHTDALKTAMTKSKLVDIVDPSEDDALARKLVDRTVELVKYLRSEPSLVNRRINTWFKDDEIGSIIINIVQDCVGVRVLRKEYTWAAEDGDTARYTGDEEKFVHLVFGKWLSDCETVVHPSPPHPRVIDDRQTQFQADCVRDRDLFWTTFAPLGITRDNHRGLKRCEIVLARGYWTDAEAALLQKRIDATPGVPHFAVRLEGPDDAVYMLESI
jgi:hypothetical protein